MNPVVLTTQDDLLKTDIHAKLALIKGELYREMQRSQEIQSKSQREMVVSELQQAIQALDTAQMKLCWK